MKWCLLLLAFSTSLAGQSLEGYVVDSLMGAPIEGAYVSARAANGAATARTDAAGHFRVEEVSPSTDLQVFRTGYRFTRWSLPRRVPGQSSQGASTVRITLTPEGVVSGRVVDEDGIPAGDALLWVQQYRLVNGERRLQPVMTRPGAGLHSDDLGQFRVGGLLPGRYIIQVLPNDLRNWDSRYESMFFPGGLQPGDKDLFEVKAGQELSVELRLTKYEGVTVSGQIVSERGVPGAGAFVSLDQPGLLGAHYSGLRRNDGSFVIRHVRPGNYNLRFQSGNYPPKAGDLIARQQLQVGDADVAGLTVTAHEAQPMDLSGTIVLSGGEVLHSVIIEAQGESGSGVTARSDDSGSFVLRALLPGRYRIQVRPVSVPTGPEQMIYAVSARLGEREVLSEGLDLYDPPADPLLVTLRSGSSDAPTFRASGTLLDAAGRPVAGARLMLLSTRRPVTQVWADTDSSGAFNANAAAGGEYRIFAVSDQSQADLLSDCDFVEAHRGDYPPLFLSEGAGPRFTLKMPATAPR